MAETLWKRNRENGSFYPEGEETADDEVRRHETTVWLDDILLTTLFSGRYEREDG